MFVWRIVDNSHLYQLSLYLNSTVWIAVREVTLLMGFRCGGVTVFRSSWQLVTFLRGTWIEGGVFHMVTQWVGRCSCEKLPSQTIFYTPSKNYFHPKSCIFCIHIPIPLKSLLVYLRGESHFQRHLIEGNFSWDTQKGGSIFSGYLIEENTFLAPRPSQKHHPLSP